jgi:AraC-like DNA-binding protein
MGETPPTGEVINESGRGRPAGRARTAVAAYQGYRQRHVATRVHLGLPSPFLTFIVTLDEPLQIARHVDRRRPPGIYQTLVGGLHTTPAVITHDGAQSGLQVLVEPLAARALFGLPAGELAGWDSDAGEVLGPISAEIQERVQTAPTWPERFAVLDEVITEILQRRGGLAAPPPHVAQAWRLLRASGGCLPIGALADAVGVSDRHLTNQFRTELGLTPKVAGRVIRFDHARRALSRRPTGPPTIAAVAAAHGYHDQSHLDRDFVAFTGRSPSRWRAEENGQHPGECGNVQAGRAGSVAN